jgi:pyroglutamyl-peptidase
MRLLITGFGPFPGMPRNPSAALARRVAASPRWRVLGIDVTCRILTTAYAALATELDPALAERPDAVLLIGVAGRSKRIRVEWRATSRRSTLFPDVAGETAGSVASGRTVARRSPIAPIKPLRALRAQKLPSRISRDAGRYLCNASYHRALALPRPVLFIHIPKPPRPARGKAGPRQRLTYDERLGAALTEMGMLLIRQARNGGQQALVSKG